MPSTHGQVTAPDLERLKRETMDRIAVLREPAKPAPQLQSAEIEAATGRSQRR